VDWDLRNGTKVYEFTRAKHVDAWVWFLRSSFCCLWTLQSRTKRRKLQRMSKDTFETQNLRVYLFRSKGCFTWSFVPPPPLLIGNVLHGKGENLPGAWWIGKDWEGSARSPIDVAPPPQISCLGRLHKIEGIHNVDGLCPCWDVKAEPH
jgi:hypothetical protein